jgi:acetoacetyl-CoA synthetase
MSAFSELCAYSFRTELPDHGSLHKWSVDEPSDFWRGVWDFCQVKGAPGDRTPVDGSDILRARFFPDARLNFARNLLSCIGPEDAIIFQGEDKVAYRWSWDRLREEVSRLQQAFLAMGIAPSDRVAAMLPNMPETVACMLAASSIGAVWATCSPDFGVQEVVDRFGQIEPRLFVTCDAYWYGGKLQQSIKAGEIGAILTLPKVCNRPILT